jgi:hypothetical protein
LSRSNNVAILIEYSILRLLLDPISDYFWAMVRNLLSDNAVTFVISIGVLVVVEFLKFPVL